MYRTLTACFESKYIGLCCRTIFIALIFFCCVETFAQGQAMAEEVEESKGLTQWWIFMVWSIGFVSVAILLSKVARKLVNKHAKDDEYRIFLSRLISVLTIIVILIGLVAIFERSFMVFATRASAAMGGWIKAIEDLIFSLFSGA
jgi:heme/copper-type cytochrome/quinol oxidase subunit 2